jgi:AcrR family transcriptional regulator
VSIREIAKEAGYTPGALYAYFSNKQALLVALLQDALQSLAESVAQVKSPKGQVALLLLAKGDAWLAYWVSHPRDLELLRYFLSGTGQTPLGVQVATQLHSAIRQTLEPLAMLLAFHGLAQERIDAEMEAILAHGTGLLLAQNTNRLLPLEHSPRVLFSDYLRRLVQSIEAPLGILRQSEDTAVAQVDLFGA